MVGSVPSKSSDTLGLVGVGFGEPEGWDASPQDGRARENVGRTLPAPDQLLYTRPFKLSGAQTLDHKDEQTRQTYQVRQ